MKVYRHPHIRRDCVDRRRHHGAGSGRDERIPTRKRIITGAEITIDELALRVKDLLQSPSTITHIPYAEAYEQGFEDMRKRAPDISKIERVIGYKPRYSLGDIIADVAEYQKLQRASAAPLPSSPLDS